MPSLLTESQEMQNRIGAWESEGGALTQDLAGTVNQIEWAERIRAQVSAEFDRVANALHAASLKQSEQDRLITQALLAILEEKRAEVMANRRAGYFIHDWQELGDQVRTMIRNDPRYKAIKARSIPS